MFLKNPLKSTANKVWFLFSEEMTKFKCLHRLHIYFKIFVVLCKYMIEVLPELQHQNKARYIYNSPPKAEESSFDPIKNLFLSCVMSFFYSEYSHFPDPIAYSIILRVKDCCWKTSSLNQSRCPFSLFQAVGAPMFLWAWLNHYVSGTLWPCKVGECPETAPAHPFIFQHNSEILCIRIVCLSEQYSALGALWVDHVKDAVKQF